MVQIPIPIKNTKNQKVPRDHPTGLSTKTMSSYANNVNLRTYINRRILLGNALADVLAGKHYLIISAIEVPVIIMDPWRKPIKKYRRQKRVCYYISPSGRLNRFLVFKYVFDINRKPVLDEIAKYEIVGDWESRMDAIQQYIPSFRIDMEHVNNVFYFFFNKNIDTICTIDPKTHDFTELLYDHVGKAHLLKNWIQITKHRLSVQREFHPSAFFEKEEQKKLLSLMENDNTVNV